MGLGEDFLDLTPKAKINKWGYIKGNQQQNDKAKQGMAENICKSYR